MLFFSIFLGEGIDKAVKFKGSYTPNRATAPE